MDEAFSLFSSAVPSCQSVGRPWSERPYKQPLFHYSYRCFNEEVDLTLLAHQLCKQPRYCHTTLTWIVPALAPSSLSRCSVFDLFLSLLSSSYNLLSIDLSLPFPLLHSRAVKVSQQTKLCLVGSEALVYEFLGLGVTLMLHVAEAKFTAGTNVWRQTRGWWLHRNRSVLYTESHFHCRFLWEWIVCRHPDVGNVPLVLLMWSC